MVQEIQLTGAGRQQSERITDVLTSAGVTAHPDYSLSQETEQAEEGLDYSGQSSYNLLSPDRPHLPESPQLPKIAMSWEPSV